MSKALVIGGSNGIGLAVSLEFASRGYNIVILDRTEPDSLINRTEGKYEYIPCDLLDFDEAQFSSLAEDMDIDAVMVTAGFGRCAEFEFLHLGEVEKLLRVNAESALKIAKIFYPRIKSKNEFKFGIMCSIAGIVSSPGFSVYAAGKAAVYRFCESVNAELSSDGFANRILCVSPGSIKGSRFSGGKNDIEALESLAKQIVSSLFDGRDALIPDYEEIYRGVIERYRNDSVGFGVESLSYKKNTGRLKNEMSARIGYLSGTFDLFHIGHLNLLRRAKEECDYLIVGVHRDASHKGKEVFIPFEERMKIVEACRYVNKVVESCREDSDAWNRWYYNRLFVGSDYKGTERFERYEEFFADKGVQIVYFPYTKGTSSTKLRMTMEKMIKK